jgi:hypothetical protein
MVADNNTLTPEQMVARIAELEGRLANSGTLSFRYLRKERCQSMGWGDSQ